MLNSIPAHMRRREKLFDGRWTPLDRNAKVRVMVRARALMRRTEPGKHYGEITAKTLAVLKALLWTFHNCRDGRCFPSYEAIAAAADCARSTVAVAIRALEDAGILTWVNRIVRVRVGEADLFGRIVGGWRVLRTSNAYAFVDPTALSTAPLASKSDHQPGTPVQVFSLPGARPDPALAAALERLRVAVDKSERSLARAGTANLGP